MIASTLYAEDKFHDSQTHNFSKNTPTLETPSQPHEILDSLYTLDTHPKQALNLLETLGKTGNLMAQSLYIDAATHFLQSPEATAQEKNDLHTTKSLFFNNISNDLRKKIEQQTASDQDIYRLMKLESNYGTPEAAQELLTQLLNKRYPKAMFVVATTPSLAASNSLTPEQRHHLLEEAAHHPDAPYSKAFAALGHEAIQNQDYTAAMLHYQTAYKNPKSRAYGAVGLGMLYRAGFGVDKDSTKAFSFFMEAAKAGNATALTAVGRMYQTGEGVQANPKIGLAYLKKAADLKGDPMAQALVAEEIWKKHGKTDKVTKYLLNALTAKEPYADYVMGKILYKEYKHKLKHGTLINDLSLQDAKEHLEKAAAQHVIQAYILLAQIAQDEYLLTEAKQYLEAAISLGNHDAKVSLGLLYNDQFFGRSYRDDALRLFVEASENSNPKAAVLAARLQIEDNNYDQAGSILQQALNSGHAGYWSDEAAYMLGKLMLDGVYPTIKPTVVGADAQIRSHALSLIAQAAGHGHPSATHLHNQLQTVPEPIEDAEVETTDLQTEVRELKDIESL
jgi:TPR repeat protein